MDREARERDIRAACQAGDPEGAVTSLLSGYGDELLAFLIARTRSETDGQDAFSQLCEDLWRGIVGFEWRSSARTWAFTLARNAAYRLAQDARRRDRHAAGFDDNARLSQLVAELRSRTARHLRTETKSRVRALRERLDPDDQMILILRVDRELSWKELAQVVLGDDQARDDGRITREAARLRKRFERVKSELRRIAVEEGLLADSGSS